jgi:hypothetical protein
MAAGDKTELTSKAKLTVQLIGDTTQSNNFNNINPQVADSVLASGMNTIGALQSHTVLSLSRTDKYRVLTV